MAPLGGGYLRLRNHRALGKAVAGTFVHGMNRAWNGVETANSAFPLATKDGRQIAVLPNATTRRDAAGEVSGVVGVMHDLSKMRQSLDDLWWMMESAYAAIFGSDTNGLVTGSCGAGAGGDRGRGDPPLQPAVPRLAFKRSNKASMGRPS